MARFHRGSGKSKGKRKGKSKYGKFKGKGTWQRMSSGGRKGTGKSKASKAEKPAAEFNELKPEERQMSMKQDGIKQKPIEGTSFLYTFDAANAKVPSRHKTQYFEIFGNSGHAQDIRP